MITETHCKTITKDVRSLGSDRYMANLLRLMMLIKVAARVIVTTRRVRILIPKHWPYAKYFEQVRQALDSLELRLLTG